MDLGTLKACRNSFLAMLRRLVREALADTRVILVNGARQAGKSTLTRLASAGVSGTTLRLLDDPATLRAAQDEPTEFVEHDGLMVTDEIQLDALWRLAP